MLRRGDCRGERRCIGGRRPARGGSSGRATSGSTAETTAARVPSFACTPWPRRRNSKSWKLIVAVALLRAMPEPATLEGQNLCHEALVEQEAIQQAESSASRMRQAPSLRVGGSVWEGSSSVKTPQKVVGHKRRPPMSNVATRSSSLLVSRARPLRTSTHQGTPPGHTR